MFPLTCIHIEHILIAGSHRGFDDVLSKHAWCMRVRNCLVSPQRKAKINPGMKLERSEGYCRIGPRSIKSLALPRSKCAFVHLPWRFYVARLQAKWKDLVAILISNALGSSRSLTRARA